MTKIIGLTGGIGSGKTTVAKFFKSLGIPVYIADDEANKISETKEVVSEIVEVFGDNILNNGKISREKLSLIVFNNTEKLEKLNAIIHPKVRDHFKSWLKKHSSEQYVVKEAAILFESGSYKDCDYVITVVAPIETRIERVMKRDNVDKKSVIKRMENQWTDEQRVSKSDFVIHNYDGNDIKKEIQNFLKKI